MTELILLFAAFVILVFATGPALLPATLGSPLHRVVLGAAASLVGIYLFGFAVYVFHLPVSVYWFALGGGVIVAWPRRSTLGELWRDRDVRQASFAWLAVAAWVLAWQCTIFSYSGADWQTDWHEHYYRSRFFIEHGDPHYRFVGVFSLAARPPLANVVTAAFLSLAGVNFHIYQATCALLASLVVWPVCLLQRQFGGGDRGVRFGWAVLLLMALPLLVQNATFAWTKLPTAFFVLCGVAVLAVREAAFPNRLAGWLALTAAMLAHYSAGPWLVAVAAADLVRSGWRSFFTRSFVKIALACGLFFLTWFGWSVWRLGAAETMGSNTTVADSAGMTVGHRLRNVAQNLYYSTVPPLFRHVDPTGYTASDATFRLRDRYFSSVQSSVSMIAGSLGVVVAVGLLWTRRRQLDRGDVSYWGTLLGVAVVLGIAVHTEVSFQGVAHICLTSFALLVIAWLAARVPGSARWWQAVLAVGVSADLVLGIGLHFATQSLMLPRLLHVGDVSALVDRLGRAAQLNLEARENIVREGFLWDLPEAAPLGVALFLAAVAFARLCFRTTSINAPAVIAPHDPPVPATLWEGRLSRGLFVVALGFFFWGASVGWENKNLAGNRARQAEAALSAHFIKQENNFSPGYPSPTLGKPWSNPREFPLYQWATVVIGKATGWGITLAGRAVSIVCFLLSLPAVYLLLARWRVEPARRWVVLAVIVSCPLYIFYGRAVLVETMALMFTLWSWALLEETIARRSLVGLFATAPAGMAAVLLSETTMALFLPLIAAWCVHHWRTGAKTNLSPRIRTWATVVAVLALLVCLGWVRYAAALRERNPLAGIEVTEHNANSAWRWMSLRSIPGDAGEEWRIVAEQLPLFLPLVACLVLVMAVRGGRWRMALWCAAFGGLPLLLPLFPVSGGHACVAHALLLPLAMGLALTGVWETKAPRWLAVLATGLVLFGQAVWYVARYAEFQRAPGPAANSLPATLQALVAADEYVILAGRDWNATVPYCAQRRALIVHDETIRHQQNLAASLANLEGEKLGALVVEEPLGPKASLVSWAVSHGLLPVPQLWWRDRRIFLRAGRLADKLENLMADDRNEVRVAPDATLPETPVAGIWARFEKLQPQQRALLRGLNPRPTRILTAFGIGADIRQDGVWLNAHPVTRLVFTLPAGRRVLRTTLDFAAGAYSPDLAEGDRTDGVDVVLDRIASDGSHAELTRWRLDPAQRPEDRSRSLVFEFQLDAAGEVELCVDPGPRGRGNRDWVWLGPLTIE